MKTKPPRLVFLLNSAQRHLMQWIGAQHTAWFPDQTNVPTPAQAGVLFALAKEDGITMGQLASALDLAPPATSGLVQRMEALHWVTRRPCPQDGRTQRVWLSPQGNHQLAPLRQAMKVVNSHLTAGFSEEELGIVARWLDHVQQLDNKREAGVLSDE